MPWNATRLTALALPIALVAACAPNDSPGAARGVASTRAEGRASSAPGMTISIAPPDVALTFARIGTPQEPRLLAVTAYRDGMVSGVDLSTVLGSDARDPIRSFSAVGYDRLAAIASDGESSQQITVAADTLLIPVDLSDRHIAAGTNYPEHAGEASVEGGPFLFAKLVRPTGPRAPVQSAGRLLDYEAELAFVPLEPLPLGTAPEWMGLILCNDYTDRETLLRHVDPWHPESGQGFATGKSFPGYLPVGDLFVIPRDYRRFAPAVELHLEVDGVPRQRAGVAEAIWQIDELLAQIRAWNHVRWEEQDGTVSLLDGADAIPARTLILSGTPSGTVFQGVTAGQKLRGAGTWVFGGWGRPLPAHVVDAYVADARRRHIYLQPGNRVVTHAANLGVIENTIEP